jgi:hypothetical protein
MNIRYAEQLEKCLDRIKCFDKKLARKEELDKVEEGAVKKAEENKSIPIEACIVFITDNMLDNKALDIRNQKNIAQIKENMMIKLVKQEVESKIIEEGERHFLFGNGNVNTIKSRISKRFWNSVKKDVILTYPSFLSGSIKGKFGFLMITGFFEKDEDENQADYFLESI